MLHLTPLVSIYNTNVDQIINLQNITFAAAAHKLLIVCFSWNTYLFPYSSTRLFNNVAGQPHLPGEGSLLRGAKPAKIWQTNNKKINKYDVWL